MWLPVTANQRAHTCRSRVARRTRGQSEPWRDPKAFGVAESLRGGHTGRCCKWGVRGDRGHGMGCLKGVGGQKGNSQTSWGLQRQDPKSSSLPPSGHSFLLALSFSTHLQFPPFCHLSDDPKIATSTPKSVWAFSSRTLHQSDNTPCVSQIKFLKERSRLARNIYGWSLPLGHVTTPVP